MPSSFFPPFFFNWRRLNVQREGRQRSGWCVTNICTAARQKVVLCFCRGKKINKVYIKFLETRGNHVQGPRCIFHHTFSACTRCLHLNVFTADKCNILSLALSDICPVCACSSLRQEVTSSRRGASRGDERVTCAGRTSTTPGLSARVSPRLRQVGQQSHGHERLARIHTST